MNETPSVTLTDPAGETVPQPASLTDTPPVSGATPPVDSPKPKKYWTKTALIIAAILAGVIVGAALGYYYFVANSDSDATATTPTPTPTASASATPTPTTSATPTPSADTYSGWQQFSDLEVSEAYVQSFDFKYPAGWKYSNGKGVGCILRFVSTNVLEQYSLCVQLYAYNNMTISSLADQTAGISQGKSTEVDRQALTVDGHAALIQERLDGSQDESKSINFSALIDQAKPDQNWEQDYPNDKFILSIGMATPLSSSAEAKPQKDLFEQIVRSFEVE